MVRHRPHHSKRSAHCVALTRYIARTRPMGRTIVWLTRLSPDDTWRVYPYGRIASRSRFRSLERSTSQRHGYTLKMFSGRTKRDLAPRDVIQRSAQKRHVGAHHAARLFSPSLRLPSHRCFCAWDSVAAATAPSPAPTPPPPCRSRSSPSQGGRASEDLQGQPKGGVGKAAHAVGDEVSAAGGIANAALTVKALTLSTMDDSDRRDDDTRRAARSLDAPLCSQVRRQDADLDQDAGCEAEPRHNFVPIACELECTAIGAPLGAFDEDRARQLPPAHSQRGDSAERDSLGHAQFHLPDVHGQCPRSDSHCRTLGVNASKNRALAITNHQ